MNLTQSEIKQMVDTMKPAEIKDQVQKWGYQAWKDNGKRGTTECATGVGKTKIGLMAADAEIKSNPNALIYIIVPTQTLRDVDWPDEMEKWGYGHLKSNPNVRLICHVSLGKEVPERDVDLIILDEVHHLTVKSFGFFNRDWKVFGVLGLTATLPDGGYDDEADKVLIINSLCPSIFQVTLEEAIELKLVSPFVVKVLMFDLDDKRIVKGSDGKMRSEQSEYQRLTNMMKKCAWMPKMAGAKFKWIQLRTAFLMNLETKFQLAKDVVAEVIKDDDKRTLLFCGSIEQANKLCGENVYHSQTNDVKLAEFVAEKISYLGVVNALNEGKNVPNLDQALIIQLSSKALALLQRIGREIRFKEGHEALIVVLVAKKTADEKWYRNAFKNIAKHRITEYYVKPTA